MNDFNVLDVHLKLSITSCLKCNEHTCFHEHTCFLLFYISFSSPLDVKKNNIIVFSEEASPKKETRKKACLLGKKKKKKRRKKHF